MHNDNISDPRWESVEKDKPVSLSPAYPSYWKEVFRKFRGNRLSVLGVICILLMTVAAILGPFLSSHSYEKMELDFTNIPPLLDIYQIDEDTISLYASRLLFLTGDRGRGDFRKAETGGK